MNTVPKLFLICTICKEEDTPSADLIAKIDEDREELTDFPVHCENPMSIIIKQVKQEKKVASLDIEQLKRTSLSGIHLATEKLFIDKKVLENFHTIFHQNLHTQIKGDDPFEIAEIIKNVIKMSVDAIPEFKQERNSILSNVIGMIDLTIKSARDRLAGNVITEAVDIQEIMTGDDVEVLIINSVGIDCGSSTTHLIFSKLTLQRESGFLNMTRRFNVVDREIVYESKIINTPLREDDTINIPEVVKFIEGEYTKANFKPEERG